MVAHRDPGILALTIFAIVFVQQGRRNVPVLFPGRRVGNRMSMPVQSNLPLMVNMAGMIPLIFAQSILTFPAIVASFFMGSKTEWVLNLATVIVDQSTLAASISTTPAGMN